MTDISPKAKNSDRNSVLACAILFALCGGTLAHPGVVIDRLLESWAWGAGQFGTGIMIMGIFAWLGTRIIGQVRGHSAQVIRLLPPAFASIGLVLLYGLALPWPGFAFVGFGVGGSTMLGNSLVVGMSGASRKLSIVNMSFTAGAVILPAITATILNHSSTKDETSSQIPWEIVPLSIAVGFIIISFFPSFREGNPRRETSTRLPSELDGQSRGVPPIKGLFWASLALFCYLGTEINLSNSWMPILHEHFSIPLEEARLANPLFWTGLLFIRVAFSVWHPHDAKIIHWLRGLGWMSVLIIAGTIGLAILSDSGQMESRSLTGILLSFCFLSGFSVGSSYSFIVALIAKKQRDVLAAMSLADQPLTSHRTREHQISSVLSWGIGGSITLPMLMGLALEHWGPLAGLGLVLIAQLIFSLAISCWAKNA